ncbi:MAG: hypothetical protein KatS3mg111_1118 [Pirellulaceae bacterium]|nr:MAG: hypothetical protein KatS3mg111_1118 [Pirellulaceae bacterium]
MKGDPKTTQEPGGTAEREPGAARLPAAPPSRGSAWVWLAGAVAILVAALLLETPGGRRVLLPGGIDLPNACGTYLLFGIDCPACGLTRSFIHLAHGRWFDAFQAHAIGPLLFAYTLLQVPLAAWRLSGHARSKMERVISWNIWLLLVLVSMMLVRWGWRLLSACLAISSLAITGEMNT